MIATLEHNLALMHSENRGGMLWNITHIPSPVSVIQGKRCKDCVFWCTEQGEIIAFADGVTREGLLLAKYLVMEDHVEDQKNHRVIKFIAISTIPSEAIDMLFATLARFNEQIRVAA